jgi:hypothetical protein
VAAKNGGDGGVAMDVANGCWAGRRGVRDDSREFAQETGKMGLLPAGPGNAVVGQGACVIIDQLWMCREPPHV